VDRVWFEGASCRFDESFEADYLCQRFRNELTLENCTYAIEPMTTKLPIMRLADLSVDRDNFTFSFYTLIKPN